MTFQEQKWDAHGREVKVDELFILFPCFFQPTNYWVSVHTLRTVSEDSILDPDDTLCDVVDDREQVRCFICL